MNKKFKLLSILSLSFMSATVLSGCVTVKDPNMVEIMVELMNQ